MKNYTIKNIRVSNQEVQLDIFVQGNDSPVSQKEIAIKIVRQLEDKIGPLREIVNLSDRLTVGLDKTSILQRVVQKFNAEQYWEAQETAEAIWNTTLNPEEKDVVQRLILVGAALVHHPKE